MEPTHLKRGSEGALPVYLSNAQPEAFERAPTLMAGETAGMQGKVRVYCRDTTFNPAAPVISVPVQLSLPSASK